MTLKSKINIDRILGNPLVLMLNHIYRLIKKKNVRSSVEIKNIIICKFMGMGSIIQSTPLMITLKDNFPGVRIIFLSVQKNKEMLGLFPFVDEILTINDSSLTSLIISTLYSFFYLLTRKIDVFVDLEIYSSFSKIFATLSLSKRRIGFFKKGSRPLNGIYTDTLYFDTNIPVKNVYLEIAFIIGCKLLKEDMFDYKDILLESEFNLYNGDYIVINPNASDLRIERKWSAKNYIGLINQILNVNRELLVVLIGSSDESRYVSGITTKILDKHQHRIINTSGQLRLPDLIRLINQSRLMITNDSGPMHIAFALKKKTIALFGPCSPAMYSNQQNVEFVYKNIHCSPCVHNYLVSPCGGNNQCMKLITVNEVIEKVNRNLQKIYPPSFLLSNKNFAATKKKITNSHNL